MQGMYTSTGTLIMMLMNALYRTPCRNDRCLFLTNIPAFPDPRLFKYNPNINLSQWEDMHESYYNSRGHYAHFPYGNAVDYDDTSAWKAQKSKYLV